MYQITNWEKIDETISKEGVIYIFIFNCLNCAYCYIVYLAHTFFIWFRPRIRTVIYIGLLLATAIMLYIVFLKRWENKSVKATYLEIQATEDYSFRKDYLVTLTARENVVHTLAFLSIAFFNGIRIAVSSLRPIGGLFLQVIILSFLFSTLNTLIWCFVHRRWHKSRYGTQ